MATACGVGQKASGNLKLASLLATPECACVNLDGSTAKFTGLQKDFTDFNAFVTSQPNAVPIPAEGKCWWPACTNAVPGVLVPSNVSSGCPSTLTNCINAISGIDANNSTVALQAANTCGGGPPNDPVATSSGAGSSAPPAAAAKPWYKTNLFIGIAVAIGVIILLAIIISLASGGSSAAPPPIVINR
jgi:hypothetical protein